MERLRKKRNFVPYVPIENVNKNEEIDFRVFVISIFKSKKVQVSSYTGKVIFSGFFRNLIMSSHFVK